MREHRSGRIRSIVSPWLLHLGLVIGLVVGGSLGLVTDHGMLGLATVAGAIIGAGIGLYVGQQLVMPRDDDGSPR